MLISPDVYLKDILSLSLRPLSVNGLALRVTRQLVLGCTKPHDHPHATRSTKLTAELYSCRSFMMVISLITMLLDEIIAPCNL
jgi:hypothetical protein